jgi:hypothetical protein
MDHHRPNEKGQADCARSAPSNTTNTTGSISPALELRQRIKRHSTATAKLAIARAQCHETATGGFIVLTGGYTRSFSDLDALEAFVTKVFKPQAAK